MLKEKEHQRREQEKFEQAPESAYPPYQASGLRWRVVDRWKTRGIIALIIAAALGLLGFGVTGSLYLSSLKDKPPVITSSAVTQRLELISELSTAKFTCKNISHFESGTIPVLTKKSFNVLYSATVKAGVDLSKAAITVSDSGVKVVLPRPSIQSVEVDPESLEFYDERFAIFNWEDRQDTVEILKAAQLDVRALAEEEGLLDQASDSAKAAVSGILTPMVLEGSGEGQPPLTLEIAFSAQ